MLSTALLPFWLALSGTLLNSYILYILALISVFFAVRVLPFTRDYENLWAFAISVLAVTPVNVGVVARLALSGFTIECGVAVDIMLLIVYYVALFCIEEAVIGIIARKIWRKQKSLFAFMQD